MYKLIKNKKIKKNIKKKITEIILIDYNYLLNKKYITCINYINISKKYSYIEIYINFINLKNKKKINIIINRLKKLEKNIIKKIKKKIYFISIKKIYFIHDNFIKKTNNLMKKIKNIKNKY